MLIYNVKRTIRKKKKIGVTFEVRIFAFHPELEPMLKVARDLASRYKKRFVVCCNEYENGRLTSSHMVCAYDCKGKNSPVYRER